RQGKTREQLTASRAEEITARVRDSMRDQAGMDAVLQGRAVPDQVQAETRALALGPYGRVGQPDLRHEPKPPKLGQHPAVDPVRLAGKRRQSFRLLGSSDTHIPAGELKLVVQKTCTTHRLDRRQH